MGNATIDPRRAHTDDIQTLEHRSQIYATRESGRAHYFLEVRAGRIEDVVVPVRLEERAVAVEVAVIRGDPVGAVVDCKEIRKKIDQHRLGRG